VADWSKSLQINLGFGLDEFEAKARLRHITPATMIYTAWGLVLSSYSFTDSVAFGTVFSGRNINVLGVDRIVGPLLSTCPFPLEFKEGQCVADALSMAQSQLLQMLEFQWSADEAVSKMSAEGIANVFQTLVVVEYDLPTLSGPCEALPEPWGIEREDMMEFGISLLIEAEDVNRLRARILYDSSRYAESGVTGLLNHFKNAINGLLDSKNTLIQDVRNGIIAGRERQALLNELKAPLNNYQGHNTVKDAFEASAAQWPDLVALESAVHGSMTYRELDEASNILANHLKPITRPGDVIGILTDGSLHWVVAILSVLKASCICCPIDVSLPIARIEIITQQSGATTFIATNQNCARVIQDSPYSHIIICEEVLASCEAAVYPLETISEPKDVVYLVFTSGSTGIPKGTNLKQYAHLLTSILILIHVIGVALHNHSLLMVIDHEPNRLFSGPGRRHGQVYALGESYMLNL
jgi:non-ribosomal peptide synthetase component F